MFAEVILNNNAKALNKIFDYQVPKELEEKVHIGARVLVPFGRSKKIEDGFIISLKGNSEYANKDIVSIENQDFMTEEKINFAKLMARKYFCNISECIKLMLPPGTGSKEIDSRVKEKMGNFVYLSKEKVEIEELIEKKLLKSDKQIRAVRFLYDNEGIYISDLEALADVSYSIIKTLEKNGYIKIQSEVIKRNPFINKHIKRDKNKILTNEQQVCFDGINYYIEHNEYSNNLIYGVTGSGKTEIYLRLIESVLNNNKSAILLVPEISLTPQMVDRFIARFGENMIAVLHSKLSIGERYDEWKKIESGEAQIVIGARSAIFAPVKKLGIIIIDEEHDMSYKSDMTPRYNAKDLAKYICKINACPLVLGSATPDINTFYESETKECNRYTLRNRAGNSTLPDVNIVDLRQELIKRK